MPHRRLPLRLSFPLAALLGAVTVLGFAPFGLFPLPVLTLAGLFLLWRGNTASTAFVLGFAFGLGFFAAGVSWVYVSLHDFGGMSLPLAATATGLFCAFLSLFTGAAGWLTIRLQRLWALGAPILWVMQEWTRGWVLTGFPWLAVGYSQAASSPLAGYAPIFGVYGVSFAMALSALLLARALWPTQGTSALQRAAPVSLLLLLWLGGWALQAVSWTRPAGEPLQVTLLQGNIPQEMKWREGKARLTLSLYAGMIQASRSPLIILPETALPLFYGSVPEAYIQRIAAHARAQNGDLLIGVPERLPDGRYYNSVISFGSSPSQIYRKHHLVPFGEYIPLKPLFGWVIRVLHIPLSDFSRGEPVQEPLGVAGQRVAISICYEDVFGEEIIRQLPSATLLANVSNDAWFGASIAPWQHMQIAQMRALETGRYMLRANNTGITAIIDERGRVQQHLPGFTPGALTGMAQGMAGQTPYTRWGNAGILGLMLLLFIAGMWPRTKPRA
jgi:apolipoprotein N-acyltransferase